MPRTKKALTLEEKRVKDRLRKRKKYAEIKNNPVLYAIWKEKEQKRYLKRKCEKKILPISKMTKRDQRAIRKQWRRNSQKYKMKLREAKKINEVDADSCNDSDEEEASGSSVSRTEDPLAAPSNVLQLSSPEKKLRKLKYTHQKRIQKYLKTISILRKENLKLRNIIRKRSDDNIQNNDSSKDYPIQREENKIIKKNIAKEIEFFFENDNFTTVAIGKKKYITKNKEKKQQRFLNDTMQNLHKKFLKYQKDLNISYATFCRYRPFWVLMPKNRDTCACIKHTNINLLIESLNKVKLLSQKNTTDVIKYLTCDDNNIYCISRICNNCSYKKLKYKECNNSRQVIYYQWISSKKIYEDRDGKMKNKITTQKMKFIDLPQNVISKLESQLDPFFKHTKNIMVQRKAINDLKISLNFNEVIVHVDFSENYELKYNREVQSFHFGSSRRQITIHTVIIYYRILETNEVASKSICTVSEDLRHNSLAIWAHLQPIFDFIYTLLPLVDTVHFLSDGPTSQYRNRFMFYIMNQFQNNVPYLVNLTWNYSEAGHGRGAPDGLGAVIKRTADRIVNSGTDIGNFDDFVSVLNKNVNIALIVINKEDIDKKQLPTNVPHVKGVLEIHQVVWQKQSSVMALRRLSCFECRNPEEKCCHEKHLCFLSTNNSEVNTETLTSELPVTSLKHVQHHWSNTNFYDKKLLLTESSSQKEFEKFVFQSRSYVKNIFEVFDNDIPSDFNHLRRLDTRSLLKPECDPNTFNELIYNEPGPSSSVSIEIGNQHLVRLDLADIEVNLPHIAIVNDSKSSNTTSGIFKEYDKENFDTQKNIIEDATWVVIKDIVQSEYYKIGLITKKYKNGNFAVSLTSTANKKGNSFMWPKIRNVRYIYNKDIILILSQPKKNKKKNLVFQNLPKYKFK